MNGKGIANDSSAYVGLSGSARSWLVAKLATDKPSSLILCPDEVSAEKLNRDLSFFLGSVANIFHFPALDTLPFDAVSPQTDILATRIRCLDKLSHGIPNLVITSAPAIMQKVIDRNILREISFSINIGDKIPRDELRLKLLAGGYRIVSLVEEVGEAAVRGNVVDIFSPSYTQPIRVEFGATGIVGLRIFDPENQRSEEKKENFDILPIKEFCGVILGQDKDERVKKVIAAVRKRALELEVPPREVEVWIESFKTQTAFPGIEQFAAHAYGGLGTIFDYLPFQTHIILLEEDSFLKEVDNVSRIIAERELRIAQEHRLIPQRSDLFLEPAEIISILGRYKKTNVDEVRPVTSLEPSDKISHSAIHALSNIDIATKLKSKVGSGDAFAPLVDSLSRWRHEGLRIAFVVGTENRAERLLKILLHYGVLPENLNISGLNWCNSAATHPVAILKGSLDEGFRLPHDQLAFIAESEIFFERSHRTPPSKVRSVKRFMSALAQLTEGDYLVHIDYGVGLYCGLVHMTVEGKGRDFLHIEYAGGTKLYLPIESIGKVQKFVSKDGHKPVLDKLGSTKWEAKKAKVRQAVVALAGELIKLYAARKVVRGWRFEPAGAEDDRFADGFGFTETPDQEKAITETLSDMASEQPMDRLVCGDAGYGKTEVALRAAYKCIQHSKQVAVLVPTTILAEQHYNVFRNRFLEYPVKVRALSRFYSSKENALTLQGLASGEVDIVIGTHKLLQPAIQFKDLGLMIIDEEHRFGVKHKEQLKQIKKDVDALTLTATPIPRTLHMALLGIREISIISTPPHDRRTIRTYVGTQTDTMVRDAILREIQRGGQCFVLHNKVQTIDVVASQLQKLVPEAKVTFAHGQMHERTLESIMMKFIKGDFDVLVSTTIIESGLDIPNANTIIILRADQLGLAQLYQIRGRVGRSNKQAYAYLMVPEPKKLSEDARKRLGVLQSLDDLGLGFNLAARDLEIRGAGNLLGKDQSGNVQTVGLDLYNRILKEAILNMRGEEIPISEVIDPDMRIPVDAYIPPNYIPDLSERLILYQRLADLLTDQQSWDLSLEIEDRFGAIPLPAQNLLQLMRLRSLIRLGGVVRIEFGPNLLTLNFSPKARIDRPKLESLIKSSADKIKQRSPLSISITLDLPTIENPADLIEPVKKLLTSVIDKFPEW